MIIFEKFSIIKFLALLFKIRREGQFYILNDCAFSNKMPDIKKIENTCRKVLPNIKVGMVGHHDFPKEFFLSNYSSTHFIQGIEDKLKKMPVYKMIMKLYPDEGVITGFKKMVLESIRKTNYFYHISMRLSEKNKNIIVVPEKTDLFGIFSKDKVFVIPKSIVALNILRDRFMSIRTFFVYLAFLFHNVHKVSAPKQPESIKYAVQIVWSTIDSKQESGFILNKDKLKRKVRWDTFFLESEDFRPDKILYCFDLWRYSSEVESKIINRIKERGGRFCYAKNLAPTWRHIVTMQWKNYGLKCLFPMISTIFYRPGSWELGHIATKFLYHLNNWEIFCLYYRPKVMMGFDDYDISHVARTMVFRKYGLKNAGIHHPAETGVYGGPNIAFVHFDMFFQYSDIITEIYSPFWNKLQKKVVGIFRSDLINQSSNDSKRKQDFVRKYGNKINILIAPPGISLVNLPTRILEFYKALAELAVTRDDVCLIIRPRSVFKLDGQCNEIMKRAFETGRVFVEVEDFDTWELIAYCDIVVSIYSSLVQESLDAGKKVIAYSFNGLDELYHISEINPFIIATSGEQLLDKLKHILNGDGRAFTIERDKRQVGFGCDGRVIERIRKGLKSLTEAN